MIDLLDIFDVYQHGKMGQLTALQADSDRRITRTGDAVRDLEQRYERLRLVTMAMWQLLKEHTSLSDADLKRFIERVDLLDGKPDGKLSRTVGAMDCSACGRRMLESATICPWCGVRNERGNAFHST